MAVLIAMLATDESVCITCTAITADVLPSRHVDRITD